MIEEKPPRKPSNLEIWLVDAEPIVGLEMKHVQTGTDTSDLEIIIKSGQSRPLKRFRWGTIEPLVELHWGWGFICRVKQHIRDDVKKWKEYEAENKAELAEFERLKKKYEAK